MYGKIFESMYEGSMIGSGPTVFAVWGYCIAKADSDTHSVLLNPVLLSTIIGTTVNEIESAISILTRPDPNSKNEDHEGKRLLHQSGFEYFVVSHEHYREMKNMSDVREYERLRKRKQREKKDVPECPGQTGTPVSVSVSDSVSVSGEKKGGTGEGKGNSSSPSSKKGNKIFKPPTKKEVSEYGKSIGFDIDGEAFVAYYESNGWMVGRSKMKKWQAAVVTWKKNANKTNIQTTERFHDHD